MDADIILRVDGWYWFDLDGRMIGPYDTKAEAEHVAKMDEDFLFFWDEEYEFEY